MSGNYLSHHFALSRCLVGQHRFTNNISNSPHILHGSTTLVINFDKRTIHIDSHLLQTPSLSVRSAADCDKNLVRLYFVVLTLGICILNRSHLTSGRNSLSLSPKIDCNLVLTKPHGDRTCHFSIINWQYSIQSFDEGYFGTQFSVSNTQFKPNIPSTNHYQPFWEFLQLKAFGGGYHIITIRHERQFN